MFMYIFHLLILFYIFLSSMYRIQSSGRSSYKEDSDSDGRVVKQAGPVKEEKPIVEERKHKEKVPKEEPPRIRKSTEKLMHERDSNNPRVVQHRPFFRRALFNVGLLLRHFDFTDEEVRLQFLFIVALQNGSKILYSTIFLVLILNVSNLFTSGAYRITRFELTASDGDSSLLCVSNL